MRRWILTVGLLTLLAAPHIAGQEVIMGNFDGVVGPCDGPQTGCNAGTGAIPVVGWAVASTGIQRIDILVDGLRVGEAIYGTPRPEVTVLVPGFPDSDLPGFNFNINSTQFGNGLHTVSAVAVTFGGELQELPGTRQILFTNNTAILLPFGEINQPMRNADLFGTCDPRAAFVRYSVVRGWALDLGVEIGDAGVGWVELMIDGAIVGNTRTTCFFSPETGGLTDCYGLLRLDVERRYPFALDAPSAGYRFVIDVGELIRIGYARGHHTLTIRAGDLSNQTANIDEIPVNFLCEEEVSEPSFGRIESPRDNRAYEDLLTFRGWALDGEGVDAVEVYVDGVLLPGTEYGPGLGTRALVAAEYPGFQDTLAPVWELRDFDTRLLSNGFHQVQVLVVDREGDRALIGEVTFFVNNPEFGATITVPGYGER